MLVRNVAQGLALHGVNVKGVMVVIVIVVLYLEFSSKPQEAVC